MINWELVWFMFFLFAGGGLLIILLMVMSVYFQESHQAKRLRLMLYLSTGLTLTLFMTFASVVITSRNEFCTNCHEMRPDTESFEKSVHSEMSCYGCHGGQGVVGFVVHKVEVMKEPFLHLTNSFEKPINGSSKISEEMEQTVCERCHDLSQRKVTPRKDLIIDHGKHKKKGIACTICHNRVAHPDIKSYESEVKIKPLPKNLKIVAGFEKEQFYPNRTKMRYCMKCHTGESGEKKGPKECKVCHPEQYIKPPKNHQIAGFVHSASTQNSLAQVELKQPPDTTKALHSEMASFDKEYCLSCHEETKFCFNCHQTKMPHDKKKWKKEHGAIGKANPEKCYPCHGETNTCSNCHHKYDPKKGPWYTNVRGRSYHPTVVRDRGAAFCFECHPPTYCSHCHVTGSPN